MRPSLLQRITWRLEAFGYDLFTAFARALPVDVASDFGAGLLARLGPLTSAHRVARINLKIVFPHADDAKIAQLLDAQWRHLGRWLMEFPILDRIIADPSRVEVVNGERLTEIARRQEPVVFISGHFSSFELMPAAIIRAGVTCHITYRATNNPYVDARIKKSRMRYGVRLFAPKGGDGARELLDALSRGETVALMNDQKFNGGVEAPLFGHMAHTAPGPARLALRFNAALQPVSVQRKERANFRIVVHDPIALQRTGDRSADIVAAVGRINAFIEARILERPAEWWWVHKRWPSEVYRRRKA